MRIRHDWLLVPLLYETSYLPQNWKAPYLPVFSMILQQRKIFSSCTLNKYCLQWLLVKQDPLKKQRATSSLLHLWLDWAVRYPGILYVLSFQVFLGNVRNKLASSLFYLLLSFTLIRWKMGLEVQQGGVSWNGTGPVLNILRIVFPLARSCAERIVPPCWLQLPWLVF